ncbi:hypothetical protein Tco_0409480 [Tanacetum coccineum]
MHSQSNEFGTLGVDKSQLQTMNEVPLSDVTSVETIGENYVDVMFHIDNTIGATCNFINKMEILTSMKLGIPNTYAQFGGTPAMFNSNVKLKKGVELFMSDDAFRFINKLQRSYEVKVDLEYEVVVSMLEGLSNIKHSYGYGNGLDTTSATNNHSHQCRCVLCWIPLPTC